MVSNERSVRNDASFVNETRNNFEKDGSRSREQSKNHVLLTQHLFTSPRLITQGEEIFPKIEK